jgi:hypothetical protein
LDATSLGESETHSSAAIRDVKFSSGGFYWKNFLVLDMNSATRIVKIFFLCRRMRNREKRRASIALALAE